MMAQGGPTDMYPPGHPALAIVPQNLVNSEATICALCINERSWQPIDTAPKDGTRILAYGLACKELAANGETWFAHDTNSTRVPFTMIIKWYESWYEADVEVGDGLFRKEKRVGCRHWAPHAHAFTPTHWMPLPEGPQKAQP